MIEQIIELQNKIYKYETTDFDTGEEKEYFIDYKGLSTIRNRVPKQTEISFVGKQSYIRENSKTIKMDAPKLLSISKMFK